MSRNQVNVPKTDFHSLILFMLSKKEDIVLVVNVIICLNMLIPINTVSNFLSCMNRFDDWKSDLEVVESYK